MDNVYGYVNGKAVYSRDEFVFACRKFGPIKTDDELLEYAKKATSNWYDAGWHRTFETFYLSKYALAEPYCSLTKTEFDRLLELQKESQTKIKAIEDARCWKYVRTECFADNSEEEIWVDKDGVEKRIITVYPHGD